MNGKLLLDLGSSAVNSDETLSTKHKTFSLMIRYAEW